MRYSLVIPASATCAYGSIGKKFETPAAKSSLGECELYRLFACDSTHLKTLSQNRKYLAPPSYMSILIVLIFFKSVCLYLQQFVLGIYEKFLNPKHKYWSSGGSSSSSSTNQCRNGSGGGGGGGGGYRSFLSSSSSSAINKTRALERERLLEQIRARKKTKIRARQHH